MAFFARNRDQQRGDGERRDAPDPGDAASQATAAAPAPAEPAAGDGTETPVAQVHAILAAAQQNAEEIERFARSEADEIRARAVAEAERDATRIRDEAAADADRERERARTEAAAILTRVDAVKEALGEIAVSVRRGADAIEREAGASALAEIAAGEPGAAPQLGQEAASTPPDPDPDPEPPASEPSSADRDGARIVALDGLLQGLSRAEVEARLREHYPAVDAAAVLDQLRDAGSGSDT